jgi:hypothetical protein
MAGPAAGSGLWPRGCVAYVSRADKARFSYFVPGSQCSNGALYQGQPSDAAAPCPIFAGQLAAAGGWCSTRATKA